MEEGRAQSDSGSDVRKRGGHGRNSEKRILDDKVNEKTIKVNK